MSCTILTVFKSFKNLVFKTNIDIFFSASIEFIQQGILLRANPDPLYSTLENPTILQNINKTEKQSKDALVKLIIYQFG